MDSAILASIDALRNTTPLVQCLTNQVVSQVTANALLAAGATPAMCDTSEESREFAHVADGVLINAGTPSEQQYAGMREAMRGAAEANTPWVLDPVAAGALPYRTQFYQEALTHSPTVIRGNASEIAALAGVGTGGRGVDATDAVAPHVAQTLAESCGSIVAVSGPKDLVVSQQGITWIAGGHPTMGLVIGTGCFLGALCAAYAGAARKEGLDLHWAIVAAHAHTKAAGAVAGEQFAQQPGSFAIAWLDALHQLSATEIVQRVELA